MSWVAAFNFQETHEAIEAEAAKLKRSRAKLAQAARELKELNQHLEDKVEARTEELSSSEKKFRHLFIASQDMVFFTDANGAIVDMNPAGLAMLGYQANELPQDLRLRDLFRREADSRRYSSMLQQVGYVDNLEAEFGKKDGLLLPVLISASALYDDAGFIIGSEGIAKDLTRLKTMMEQLAASEKMASVGQMAAGIAHEINTPLGIILGYAQLMMDEAQPGSETLHYLEAIERQTKASRKIVADLLKYSHQSNSARELVDLNEIVEEVTACTGRNLKLNNIEIRLDLATDLPQLVGDAEKLRQVLLNLITNAHHAMEDRGGELCIQTAFDAEMKQVRLEIRDTGSGVSEHIKSRIFDPFFTTKPVGKGTGLGLSVSYGIIHEHQGQIEVESPVLAANGVLIPGAVFRLRLPAP